MQIWLVTVVYHDVFRLLICDINCNVNAVESSESNTREAVISLQFSHFLSLMYIRLQKLLVTASLLKTSNQKVRINLKHKY
jgi:hypothetical protein